MGVGLKDFEAKTTQPARAHRSVNNATLRSVGVRDGVFNFFSFHPGQARPQEKHYKPAWRPQGLSP